MLVEGLPWVPARPTLGPHFFPGFAEFREKMESRPARLFGCAWRANGRKAVKRQALEEEEKQFTPTKRHPFPQRPKDRVCDFTALLLIYEYKKDHV